MITSNYNSISNIEVRIDRKNWDKYLKKAKKKEKNGKNSEAVFLYTELFKVKKDVKIQKRILEIQKKQKGYILKEKIQEFITEKDLSSSKDLLLRVNQLFIQNDWGSKSYTDLIADFLSKYFSILLKLNRDDICTPSDTNTDTDANLLIMKLINDDRDTLSKDKIALVGIIANNLMYWDLLMYFRAKYYFQSEDFTKALFCLNEISSKNSEVELLNEKKEALSSFLNKQLGLKFDQLILRIYSKESSISQLVSELEVFYSSCKYLINDHEVLLCIFYKTILAFFERKKNMALYDLYKKESFQILLGQLVQSSLRSPKLLSNKKMMWMMHDSLDMLVRALIHARPDAFLSSFPFILNVTPRKFKNFPQKVKDIAIKKIKPFIPDDGSNELFHQSNSAGLLARKIEEKLSINGNLAIYYICLTILGVDNDLSSLTRLTIDFMEALKKSFNVVEKDDLIYQFIASCLMNAFLRQSDGNQLEIYKLERVILDMAQSQTSDNGRSFLLKKINKEIKTEYSLVLVLDYLKNKNNVTSNKFTLEFHLKKIRYKVLVNKNTLENFLELVEESNLAKDHIAQMVQFLQYVYVSLKRINSDDFNNEIPLALVGHAQRCFLEYTKKHFKYIINNMHKQQKVDFGPLWKKLEQTQIELDVNKKKSMYRELKNIARDLLVENISFNTSTLNMSMAISTYRKYCVYWKFTENEIRKLGDLLFDQIFGMLHSQSRNIARMQSFEQNHDSLYEYLVDINKLDQCQCFFNEVFSLKQQGRLLALINSEFEGHDVIGKCTCCGHEFDD